MSSEHTHTIPCDVHGHAHVHGDGDGHGHSHVHGDDDSHKLCLVHVHGDDASRRYNLPTGRNLFKTKCITLEACADVNAKREELRQYFHDTFELYEKVFECLNSYESFTIKPVHKLRHPLIFYYGHTATFYINKMVLAGLTTRINPRFEEMFAVGVDEMSWDDLNDMHYHWPTIEEISQYRQLVRERMNAMMTSGKFRFTLPQTFADSTASEHNAFWWVINMGAEHERIHLETASVHVRELPARLVIPSACAFWAHCLESNSTAPTNEMIEVEGGNVRIGRDPTQHLYGWDSDYAVDVTMNVAPFKASKYLVSNGEFFAFIKAEGYKNHKFWDEEGWNWITYAKPEHPWFWVRDAHSTHGYKLRLQTTLIDLPWDWPVEVNHLEAKAFCAFKGDHASSLCGTARTFRLPTEAEWLLLRDRYVKQDQFEWSKAPGNVNLEHYASSCPVNKFPQGPFFDIVGNTWQHCETPVYPYAGYKVHPFYDDFSMPTFDGRHLCMKGGAWISTGNEATRDARFAFRRHFFQCIGIRYVEGEPVNEAKHLRKCLGMDPDVDAATDFAFGQQLNDGLPNAAMTLAHHAVKIFEKFATAKPLRALELACGAGRLSFELTPHFAEVIGSDSSARKLIPAFSIRERGAASYTVVEESGKRAPRAVVAGDYPAWKDTRERAVFYQADPANLHAHMTHFDLIVAWNAVLETSYRPSAIPALLLSRLNKGGIIIFASTYAWSEGSAERSAWLTNTSDTDRTTPKEALLAALGGSDAVEAVGDAVNLHALYPETERTARYGCFQVLSYRKK